MNHFANEPPFQGAGVQTRRQYSLHAPCLLRLALCCWMPLFVLTLSASLITRREPFPLDPLQEYANLTTATSMTDLLEYGFSCPSGEAPQDVRTQQQIRTCMLHLPEGQMSSILITYKPITPVTTSIGVTCAVVFTLHDPLPRLGDLILLWGMPQLESPRLIWQERNISVTHPKNADLDYSRRVETLMHGANAGC
jgi:hypothetical protein